MKKLALLVFLCSFFTATLFAQYCGTSGAVQCTPNNLSQPGLSPPSDSLAPFINGLVSTTVIQFKNFNQVYYFGGTYTVQWLRIDTISNLPAGLCWSCDDPNNTYTNQENGCIKVNGTACDAPGEYKLRIICTVDIGGFSVQVNADDAGLKYFVRLINMGDTVPAVDTLQTVAFSDTGYSTTAVCNCPAFNFTQSSTSNTLCGNPNGSATVSATGGVGPYTYKLGNTTNTTGVFTGLSGGTYTVVAADTFGCTDTVQVTVPSTTPPFVFTVSNLRPNTSCNSSNGGFNVSVTGGNAPYTYSIGSGSNSTGSFTALAAGNYVVTASDANQCIGTQNVIVMDSLAQLSTNITMVNASTATAADGSATVTVTGGTAPYNYGWSSGQTTSSISGVTAGFYSVTVVDVNGCTASGNTTIGFTNALNDLPAQLVNLHIFPNPASTMVNVSGSLNGAMPVTLVLLNSLGQKVLEKNLGITAIINEALAVNGLTKGLYWLQVKTGSSQTQYPVSVQ